MDRPSKALIAFALIGAACSAVPRPGPQLAQNREVEGFAAAAAWPNAEPAVAIIAAQEFLASRHDRDGYEYFHRLAREQPDRPILASLEGVLQARSAGEIPLLQRVSWVEEAIRKLDRGAEAEPVAGQLLRGLVFADLPERFGKAKQAVTDLEASLARREAFPVEIDRGVLRALASAWRTLGDEKRSREMLRRAGYDAADAPAVAGNISVGPEAGFRFTDPKLVRETDGVYVAEGFDFRLIPARGGETEDALFIHLPRQGLLFVGDAFMPYVGPPFLSEGSPEGYVETLAMVRSIGPRRLIHGHPPLTRFFNVDAIAGLEAALRNLYERYLPEMVRGRPLAEILHDNYLPPTLRESPKAVIPYLITRDHFLQRVHRAKAGYWQADGEGMDVMTRSERAALLDQFGDGTDAPFIRVAENLIARGDGPLALSVTDMGLLRYPSSERLRKDRKQALSMLIERYNPVNPFRFIIYSQWAGMPLPPVGDAVRGAQ